MLKCMVCTESYVHPYHRNSARKTKWIDLPSVDTESKRWSVFFFVCMGLGFDIFQKISFKFPARGQIIPVRCTEISIPQAAHGCLWVKFYLFWFLVKTITDIFYWSLTTVSKHFSPAQHCKTFPNLSINLIRSSI